MSDSLSHRFKFHPATTRERQRDHEFVRGVLGAVAVDLAEVIPPGREAALVTTKLEEAMFWANAAIARQPAEVSE